MSLNPDALHKPVRRLRKLLKKLPKRPVPEDVHSLRTNTRRLEATLEALAVRPKGTLNALERVRLAAGKVRDMDVLIHFASLVHPDGEDDCSVRLIEHLGAMRLKHSKRLRSVVAKYGARARKRLKKTDRVIQQAEVPGQKATAAALMLEEHLKREPLGPSTLHLYRLKVKQLRNTLRLAEHGDGELLDTLAEVKDVIGEWHDWTELHAIAKHALDHGQRCGLLRELKRTCDSKYDHALRVAKRLQRSPLDEGHHAAARLA